MVTLIGAVATSGNIMLERQREGIALAKSQGKYKGRASKTLPDNFKDIYDRYMNREIIKSRCLSL